MNRQTSKVVAAYLQLKAAYILAPT